MNVTLTLDDKLVKEVRKIAVERDTTLTGLIRAYLEGLAAQHVNSDQKRRELEALEKSFRKFSTDINYGERTWKREDLYDRPKHRHSKNDKSGNTQSVDNQSES